MMPRIWALAAAALMLAPAALSQPVPGDFLVTEQYTGEPPADDGEIVNIRGGGDVTSVPRFATGMNVPQDLCIGPGGELYVTEFRDGTILIVREGDDASTAVVHASGLSSPRGLLCSDTQILVVEQSTTGEVTDATAGGDLTGAQPFAWNLGTGAIGLLRDSMGRTFVSMNDPAKILDITDGGDFTGATPFADGIPFDDGFMGMAEWEGALLVADLHNDTVIDFTDGGDLMDNVIMSLNGVEQLEAVPGLGLFALRTNNEVVEISTWVALPYATGLSGVGSSGGILYVPGCGDGLVQTDETCDDGNTVDGDACRNDCTTCGDGVVDPVEECDDGNSIDGDGCTVDCVAEFCGDGIQQSSEGCDDGNTVNGDGCDATCLTEVCGNGVLQLGEQCDDGNSILGDGCDVDCLLEICGNGVVQFGETCDDGNTQAGDGCRHDCTTELCGDGIWDPQEVCDDGNTLDGDTCSGDCTSGVPEPWAPLSLGVGAAVLGLARRRARRAGAR
ncbi:MAG: DUF4215 domain-containing protein [Myxococcales bacterium]|nr:DUF4215 domain-containing protein [Myxococcales bacterium]